MITVYIVYTNIHKTLKWMRADWNNAEWTNIKHPVQTFGTCNNKSSTENSIENNKYFLPEVSTEISRHVDLRTLVFSCTLVCRFWRNVVESCYLCRIKVAVHGDKVATEVVYVHHPWYICYILFKDVFNTNLFPCSEGMQISTIRAQAVLPRRLQSGGSTEW